jgi:hypothetical protein
MHDAADHVVILQLAQLLNEHLLRDPGNGSLKLREAQDLAAEEMKKDYQLPAPFQHP